MLTTTLLAPLALVAPSLGSAAVPPIAEEWIALPLPAPAVPRAVLSAPLPAADGSHLSSREWPEENEAEEAAEIPAPMVVQWLQEEARRRGSTLSVAPNTPPLLLSGGPEDLAWAREWIDGLDALDERLAIELEAYLVPAALPAGAAPSPGDAPAGMRRFAARVRSGEGVLLGDRSRRTFLADYDVEVATDSGVSSPVVGRIELGERVHLRAHRVEGGRAVHVEGVLDLAELAALEEFDPGTPDLGVTEQPLVDVANVVFSGRVRSGEVLRVALEGTPVGEGAWTLFVRATTTPDPAPGTGWSALDLGLLASAPARIGGVDAGAGLASETAIGERAGRDVPFAPSAVLALLGRDRRRDLERPPVQWTDRLLLVHAEDPARYAELRALVDQLEAVRAATTTCRVATGGVTVEWPTAAGAPTRVMVGTERTLLVDYDIEIAPNTWMPAPRTERAFDGLALAAHSSGASLVGECFVSATDDVRVLNRGSASLGSVQLPARRAATGAGRVGAGESETWIPAGGGHAEVVVSRARP